MPNAKQPLSGNILRGLRNMKGIKQDAVAKTAGICQQYYSRVERGEKNISEEAYNHIVTCNKYTAEEIEIVKKFLPFNL